MLIKLNSHEGLRQRLVMSTLSGKILRIDGIRSDSDEPGLKDYEVNFLRLLEKFTNGSHIEISVTGTSLVYKPGVIVGGKVSHDCGVLRSIGYFLEPLIMLAPFAKNPVSINLQGITNDNLDISVIIKIIQYLYFINILIGGFIKSCYTSSIKAFWLKRWC
jgi:RNA 3'-terminal phosphate cyclase-like protein